MLSSSSEAVVVIEQGSAIKTRAANVRIVLGSETWAADRILGMRAVPWLPDGSDTTFDTQAGMVPPSPGELLMETKSSEDLISLSRLRSVGSQ